jgi:nucleoside phosphorylase
MGPERAAQALDWLTHRYQLRGVLSVGFAGGLQTSLTTGDAVLVSRVLAHAATPETAGMQEVCPIVPDARLARLAAVAATRAALVTHVGTLLSTTTVVSHAAAKQRFGHLSGALAVDMESYSIGQAARRYHLPFMVLRTIFDGVEEDCSLPVEAFTTPDGALQPLHLLDYLARHPRTFGQIPHLWWKARKAGSRLQSWLQHFLTLLPRDL